MNSKTSDAIILTLIAAAFVAGVVLYPHLPDQMASHWNAAGEVNGTMGKFWGAFLLPVMLVGMYFLYWIIPAIDPLKANIASFRKYYSGLWMVIFLFMIYVYGLQLAWNMGWRFNFTVTMIPALSAMAYGIGAMLEKSKRNWFVGIRTPWTLSSDVVWEKTNVLGGKLFKAWAVIALLGLLAPPSMQLWLIVVPILAIAAITVIYSYVEFRKQA